MQLSWRRSTLSSNVRCPLCGQGFLIYALHVNQARQDEARGMIQQTLRQHHRASASLSRAHPFSTFSIPSWAGAPPFSASAALSDLLDNAI